MMNNLTLESWREARRDNRKSLNRMQRNGHVVSKSWHGMAFIIEAVILLFFIAISVAVFFRLLSYSEITSASAADLSSAIASASNTAELFAADPVSMSGYAKAEGDYYITCDTETSAKAAGTMYEATIKVTNTATDEVVYTLTTSRYVSEVE